MEFRYRDFDGVPPPQFSPTSNRIFFASHPPPPYHDSYFQPSDDAYEPYDYRYFSSRERMLEYRPQSEEPPSGHNSIEPSRPCRDPFLDREYERERIREEILREEVYKRFMEEEVRRRLIKEEVRRELEMEYYYGLRYTNLGYQGAQPELQFERPGYSHGCYIKGSRGQAPRNRYKGKRCVKNVQHKIMEINEDELMAKLPVSGEKVQPSNADEIQKRKDKVTVQTEENGNEAESNVSEIPRKIVEIIEEETRPSQTLLIDNMKPIKNQEQVRPKAYLLAEALPKDKIKSLPNGNNIVRKGDENKVLEPQSEHLAFSKSLKELSKEAEACGSKRKGDLFSALPTPATTSGSTDTMGSRKAKKRKFERKKYICTLCQATIYNDHDWLCHLNGNRHRNMVERKSGTGLAAVNLEMDNGDSLAGKPTGKQLQTDVGLIKKIQVGHEVHEVVEKNNRLWCEKCKYNCTSTVMMTIHLVSEKHKRNCQKP